MFDNIPMNEGQQKQTSDIKAKAQELLDVFNSVIPTDERSEASRLMAIARTNLEQCIMWAVKAVSRKQ